MNTFSKLSVLRGLSSDPLLAAFARWRENESDLARKAEFLSQLFLADAQDDFTAYVTERILLDENPFSRACAAERPVSPYLYRAFLSDLGAIRAELSEIRDTAYDISARMARSLEKSKEPRQNEQER